MTDKDAGSAAISTRGLSKSFDTKRAPAPGIRGLVRGLVSPVRETVNAVTNVNLTVQAGELVLLLGPNGAGKSTLIKMLTGVVRPTTGSLHVAGLDPAIDRERHAKLIGTVFGQRSQLWWDLPVRESYVALQAIYGLSDKVVRERLHEFDDILSISEFWNQRMRHLSLGQRVRADLAGALLHGPEVIFLDEPTIGMDVVVKEQVRGFLRKEVSDRGCTVLMTTHDMNEVKRLGSRVVVINHGQIVSDGDLDELLVQFGTGYAIEVSLGGLPDSINIEGLEVRESRGSTIIFVPIKGLGGVALSLQEALAKIVTEFDVRAISVEEDEIEDVMRSVFLETEAAPRA